MRGFAIDLGVIPSGLNRVQLESPAEDLGLSPAEWPGMVAARLDVEKSGDRVSVRGSLKAVAVAECVRCLRSYELPLETPFELFAERAGTGFRPEEEDLERDHYMKFHDGRKLDVREEVRETLLLELPIAPRCREDCRGLCPRCGADLNEGPCSCVV